MALASIAEIPGTPQDFAVWSFAHAAQHRDIIRVIFQNDGTILDEYVLDPFNPADPDAMSVWLASHQVMHQQMDAALGIAGYDLSTLDWDYPDDIERWWAAHTNEHYQAGVILGLG